MNSSSNTMIRLLGAPALERDGTLVTGRAAHRHRIAVLALLALAPSRRMSRERIAAWLWPEADAERARNLLNVAAYVLRAALGGDALVSAGEELRLGDGVRSDVSELESAVARGDWDAAAALYAGPFLDGFFLPEAAEFEGWVAGERQRLASLQAKAVEALADRAERNADWAAAAERWRARSAGDPYDSRIALRLMRALDASGNRAAALQHAARHAALLREELGIESSDVAAAAEALRNRSDIPVRPASPAPTATVREAELPAATSATGASRLRVRLRRTAVFGLGLALLAIAAVAAVSRTESPERSIVVLPFASLAPGGEQDHFTDGLTDEIAHGLSRVPGLTVIAHSSALRYGASVVGIADIAGELGVTHVLHGTVRRDGARARITARLVGADRERVLWSGAYDSEVDDVLGVQERIAREVVRALALQLGDDTGGPIVRHGTEDSEALDYYRRGRFFAGRSRKEDVAAAMTYFERAIARDSSYADAWAGLADGYFVQWRQRYTDLPESEARARAVAAAARALALDPESADAHAAYGAMLWWQRDAPASARAFQRALELNPSHRHANHGYAVVLTGYGRLEEARRSAARITELDPHGLSTLHAWLCYLTRDWECTIEQSRRTLEIDTAWTIPHVFMARAYTQLGRREEALAAMERPWTRYPGGVSRAEMAAILATFGQHDSARAMLARAKTDTSIDLMTVARAHVALGERDSAFAVLERQPTWLWPDRVTIYDPGLDPIRDDPRMDALRVKSEREMGVR